MVLIFESHFFLEKYMITELIYSLVILSNSSPLAIQAASSASVPTTLGSHTMPLNDRYSNEFVNTVFKDNILLTMAYMNGEVKSANQIAWKAVEKPFSYEFSLKPNETFAFHDNMLPEYAKTVVKTTNAHFNYSDGFKSDGYLTGDGVCHLASLIYWVAKDAGLNAVAPSNHDFAVIPDVPKKYGVAIYEGPSGAGTMQNLYITNDKKFTVRFVFEYKDNALTLNIVEAK